MKLIWFSLTISLLTIGCVSSAGPAQSVKAVQRESFVPLFDGHTLNGWFTLPGGQWSVKDGLIVGLSSKDERRHGLLLTEKQYDDFEVRVTYKILKGNSGLYFRCDTVDHFVGVAGFQAEIDAEKDVGGLYETLGRQWVSKPDAVQVSSWFKPGEWNVMTVRAIGDDITVKVNDKITAQLKNDPGRRSGFIGLQLHGNMEMEVYFRSVEIWHEPLQ